MACLEPFKRELKSVRARDAFPPKRTTETYPIMKAAEPPMDVKIKGTRSNWRNSSVLGSKVKNTATAYRSKIKP
jgi:hypothetical protein